MIHNLTDKQLQVLRWIIRQINDGELGESFIATDDYPDFDILDALVASKLLVSGISQYGAARFTITRKAYEIATFDFDNPEPDPKRSYLKETLRLIPTSFEPEEFKEVCFDLGINPDWELGDKKTWPLELLRYLYRRKRLNELPAVLSEHRPEIDWPDYPGDETAV